MWFYNKRGNMKKCIRLYIVMSTLNTLEVRQLRQLEQTDVIGTYNTMNAKTEHQSQLRHQRTVILKKNILLLIKTIFHAYIHAYSLTDHF